MDNKEELFQINKILALKGIRLKVEKRGQKLNIRGPLPSKTSEEQFKVQRISLNIFADLDGLKEAAQIAELISYQLKHKQFSWSNWSKKKNDSAEKKKVLSINEVLDDFKDAFFSDPKRSVSASSRNTTWESAYKPYLKRVMEIENQFGKKLNKDLFLEVLLSYKENSRSRQQCAIAIASLARHLNLELPDEWTKISAGYGINESRFRELPSDELIKRTFKLIPNPKWQFVFALMATYGLRNHEVFYCDLSCLKKNEDKILRVFPTTKTGEHQVWPFHPEWVDCFKLSDINDNSNPLPKIKTDLNSTTLQKVGRRVSEQFKRYKLPITPYDLRHAWAVRTILIGLPNTVAARMMGHSVSIHTKTYHHWITRRDQQQAVDTALARRTI